ncbi:penicillin acylase family protein [Streptomyces rubiginosohelvolus]|uniref:penicillin acylase family protein n=1 Tax=Streptomyces rubiginosohelvolus TaxID=67362 RepID=UPI003658D760
MSSKVFRDAWGVPHLWADDPSELAFTQGRNAAHDRAWQLEVERLRCEGSTAALFGAEALGWDRFARQSRLDDTARRCFERLAPDTRTWVEAYVHGVNECLPTGAGRAPEFAETGLTPGRWQPWTPLGLWLSMHVLAAGFPNKLWRQAVESRLGPGAVDLFTAEGPGGPGSNGWLLGAERTAAGAPLLAGDPHRIIESPGVYQQIRLACPEFDVVGLAMPGVPGIPHFGHGGKVAWAITHAMADYQDLYQEILRRDGPDVHARGPQGWEPVARHVERVDVRDAGPVDIEVLETARGPVVVGGPDETQALSLRHPPRVWEDLGFDALPALLRAADVRDVDAALDRWVEPVNVVQAADTSGGLLHRVAGCVPVRPERNKLVPVPAWETRYAWQGRVAELPRERVRDLAVMANDRGVAAPFGVEFAPPHRAARIRRLLTETDSWEPDGMTKVHTDTLLPSAALLLARLERLGGLSDPAGGLRGRLLDWDRHMDADSTSAALYGAVRAAAARRIAGHAALAELPGLVHTVPAPDVLLPWLMSAPKVAFALDNFLAAKDPLGIDTDLVLRESLEEVATRTDGPVSWGDMHRLSPWSALPPDPAEERPALSGSFDCVLSTASIPTPGSSITRGPVARYVWALARREDSRWIVPLGADGVPGSPHHRDQMPLWSRGELAPVVTDWNHLTEETTIH